MTSTVVTNTSYRLPTDVVTKADLARLVSDAERVDNELTTMAVHDKAHASLETEVSMTERLSAFLQLNELEFGQDARDRMDIIRTLRYLKDKAPIVHMTFATEADRESLAELVEWLRSNVHPQAIVTVGLQPALIAGVYVRTTNQVHDLSLRGKILGGRDILIKQLVEATRG